MKHALRLVIAAGFLASPALAAGPVREYTRDVPTTRSEELRSVRPLIPATDPRRGLLITPAPYPNNRTDDVDRPENGRLWVSRSPIGSRRPIAETTLTSPGPAFFGAGVESHHDVIFIQPSEIREVIGLSPWQQIDDNTLRQIQRLNPNLGKTPDSPESARLLAELRAAQNQWLEEQGYILRVRTHVNPSAGADAAEAQARNIKNEIRPRAVIRVVPQAPAKKIAGADAAGAPGAG